MNTTPATTSETNYRVGLLEIEVDSLRRQLSTAEATQRECMYWLLGSVVFTSLCTMLALV